MNTGEIVNVIEEQYGTPIENNKTEESVDITEKQYETPSENQRTEEITLNETVVIIEEQDKTTNENQEPKEMTPEETVNIIGEHDDTPIENEEINKTTTKETFDVIQEPYETLEKNQGTKDIISEETIDVTEKQNVTNIKNKESEKSVDINEDQDETTNEFQETNEINPEIVDFIEEQDETPHQNQKTEDTTTKEIVYVTGKQDKTPYENQESKNITKEKTIDSIQENVKKPIENEEIKETSTEETFDVMKEQDKTTNKSKKIIIEEITIVTEHRDETPIETEVTEEFVVDPEDQDETTNENYQTKIITTFKKQDQNPNEHQETTEKIVDVIKKQNETPIRNEKTEKSIDFTEKQDETPNENQKTNKRTIDEKVDFNKEQDKILNQNTEIVTKDSNVTLIKNEDSAKSVVVPEDQEEILNEYQKTKEFFADKNVDFIKEHDKKPYKNKETKGVAAEEIFDIIKEQDETPNENQETNIINEKTGDVTKEQNETHNKNQESKETVDVTENQDKTQNVNQETRETVNIFKAKVETSKENQETKETGNIFENKNETLIKKENEKIITNETVDATGEEDKTLSDSIPKQKIAKETVHSSEELDESPNDIDEIIDGFVVSTLSIPKEHEKTFNQNDETKEEKVDNNTKEQYEKLNAFVEQNKSPNSKEESRVTTSYERVIPEGKMSDEYEGSRETTSEGTVHITEEDDTSNENKGTLKMIVEQTLTFTAHFNETTNENEKNKDKFETTNGKRENIDEPSLKIHYVTVENDEIPRGIEETQEKTSEETSNIPEEHEKTLNVEKPQRTSKKSIRVTKEQNELPKIFEESDEKSNENEESKELIMQELVSIPEEHNKTPNENEEGMDDIVQVHDETSNGIKDDSPDQIQETTTIEPKNGGEKITFEVITLKVNKEQAESQNDETVIITKEQDVTPKVTEETLSVLSFVITEEQDKTPKETEESTSDKTVIITQDQDETPKELEAIISEKTVVITKGQGDTPKETEENLLEGTSVTTEEHGKTPYKNKKIIFVERLKVTEKQNKTPKDNRKQDETPNEPEESTETNSPNIENEKQGKILIEMEKSTKTISVTKNQSITENQNEPASQTEESKNITTDEVHLVIDSRAPVFETKRTISIETLDIVVKQETYTEEKFNATEELDESPLKSVELIKNICLKRHSTTEEQAQPPCESEQTKENKIVDKEATNSKNDEPTRSPKKKPSRQFQCKKCFEMFGNIENLLKHDNHVHFTSKATFCKICNRNFRNENALKMHNTNLHKNVIETNKITRQKSSLFCQKCKNKPKYRTQKDLNNHLLIFHKGKACDFCSEVFFSDMKLLKHKLNHHKVNEKNDEITLNKEKDMKNDKSNVEIKVEFKNSDKMVSDNSVLSEPERKSKRIEGNLIDCLKSDQEKQSEVVSLFKCDKCELSFKSKYFLGKHKCTIFVNPSNLNTCNFCHETIRRSHYEKHVQTCRENFTCSYCHKMFCNKSLLRNHFEKSHNLTIGTNKKTSIKRKIEFIEVVQVKSKKFDEESTSVGNFQLSSVSKKRKSDNAETLDSANKKLKTKKNVSVHVIELQCTKCDKVFFSQNNLDNHLLQDHGTLNCIKCEECSKTFRSQTLLDKHVINAHKNAIKCKMCCKVFKTLYLYSKHNRIVHNASASPDKLNQPCKSLNKLSTSDTSSSTVQSLTKPSTDTNLLQNSIKSDSNQLTEKCITKSDGSNIMENNLVVEIPISSDSVCLAQKIANEVCMTPNSSKNHDISSTDKLITEINIITNKEYNGNHNICPTEKLGLHLSDTIHTTEISSNKNKESLTQDSCTNDDISPTEELSNSTEKCLVQNLSTNNDLCPIGNLKSNSEECLTQNATIKDNRTEKLTEIKDVCSAESSSTIDDTINVTEEVKVETELNCKEIMRDETDAKEFTSVVPLVKMNLSFEEIEPTIDKKDNVPIEDITKSNNENIPKAVLSRNVQKDIKEAASTLILDENMSDEKRPKSLIAFINLLKEPKKVKIEDKISSNSAVKERLSREQKNSNSSEHNELIVTACGEHSQNISSIKREEILPKLDVKLNFMEQFQNSKLSLDPIQLKYPEKMLLPLPSEESQIYKCSRCDKPYNDKMELRQHISDRHIALPPLDEAYKKEKKFKEKCSKKSYVLVKKDQLHSVLKNELLKSGSVQNKDKLFYALNIPELKCCHCEAIFTSQKNLELHSKTFHTHHNPESQTASSHVNISIANLPDNNPPIKSIQAQRRNSIAGTSTTSCNDYTQNPRRSSTSTVPFLISTVNISQNPSIVPVIKNTLSLDSSSSSSVAVSNVAPNIISNTAMITPGSSDLQCSKCGIKFNNGPERHFCTVFKCDKCSETFITKELLNAHYLLKHDIYLVPKHVKNINEFANIKNLDCKFCTAMFIKNKDLNQHYREYHKYSLKHMKTSVIKNYKDVTKFIYCTMCNDIFNSNFDLQKHYLDYHNYDSSIKKFEVTPGQSTQIGNLLKMSSKKSSVLKKDKIKNIEESQHNDKVLNNLNNINNVLNDALGYTVSSTVLNNMTPVSNNPLPELVTNSTTIAKDVFEKQIGNPVKTNVTDGTVEPSASTVIVNLAGNPLTSSASETASLEEIQTQKSVKYLTCIHCFSIFTTAAALSVHLSKEHPAFNTPLKCDFCSSMFGEREELSKHIEKIHKDLQTCIQCNRKFSNKYNLKRHVAVTHDSRYVCNLCNDVFPKKCELTKHRLSMHPEKVLEARMPSVPSCLDYQCHLCGRYLSSKYHLRRHMDNIHNSKIEILKQCKTCLKGIAGPNRFSAHLMVDHKIKHSSVENFIESSIECYVCEKIFINKKTFKVHMKKKHDFKPHQCHICSRTYAFKKHITRHMEIHDSLKDFLSFSVNPEDENDWGEFGNELSDNVNNMNYEDSQTVISDTQSMENSLLHAQFNVQHINNYDPSINSFHTPENSLVGYNKEEPIHEEPLEYYQTQEILKEDSVMHSLDNSNLFIQNIESSSEQNIIPANYQTPVIKTLNQHPMSVVNTNTDNLINIQPVNNLLHPNQLIQDNLMHDQSMEYTDQRIQGMTHPYEEIQNFSSLTEQVNHPTLNSIEPASNQTFHLFNRAEEDHNLREFHELQNSQNMEMMQSLDETNFQPSEEQDVCKTLILQNAEPSQHSTMILNSSGQSYISPNQLSYVPQIIDSQNQSHVCLVDQPPRESVVLQTPMSQIYDPSFQNALPSSLDMTHQTSNSAPIFVLLLKQPDQSS